jgi:prepilin-type N-terminal cleavage/methylation domain-containing protein
VSPAAPIVRSRRGFTLIELLIVVAVIILIATMMLGIRASNPDALSNGQRMMGDMLRIARVQAQMNRAAVPMPDTYPVSATKKWAPTNFRYRLLIKCDPTDPDTHLREMVLVVGFTGIGASVNNYVWFSPEPAVRLPPGVFFVPPNLNATNGMASSPNPAVALPSGTSLSGTALTTRISMIPRLGDTTGLVAGTNEYLAPTTAQAPMMLYRPIFSPLIGTTEVYYNTASVHTAANGAKYWYYVELGPDGTNNHLGKVVLVLAEGTNTGGSVLLTAPDKFAGILLRRNGDISLTTDTDDFESASLK